MFVSLTLFHVSLDLGRIPPKTTRSLLGHESAILALTLVQNKYLFTGSADGLIYVWDLENKRSPEKVRELQQLGYVRSLATDGLARVFSTSENDILVWNFTSESKFPSTRLEGHRCARHSSSHASFPLSLFFCLCFPICSSWFISSLLLPDRKEIFPGKILYRLINFGGC